MQVFKAFYKSLLKRISSVALYVIIFAIIAIIMSKTWSSNTVTEYSASKVPIAVFDHDQTTASHALYDYLAQTQKIVTISEDKESIADELFYRNVEYVLTIPEGFSEDFTCLTNVKQSNSASGYFIDNAIDTYLKLISTYTTAGYSMEEAAKLADSSANISSDATILSEKDTTKASASDQNALSFFRYLPYIFIAAIMTSLGGILILFRQKDLNLRMNCSALSVMRKNIELSSACITYSLLLWCIFMALGICLYPDTFLHINGLLFAGNSLAFLIFTVSITYFVSFFANNDNVINMLSNIIGLGMAFLSGVFIPLEVLSSGVKKFAHFLPAFWYIKAADICTSYNGNTEKLTTYFAYLGIQLLFAAAFFAAALVTSKYKKETSK